jgi:hypothetical protein
MTTTSTTAISATPTVALDELEEFLIEMIKQDIAAMVWGAPGLGKTELFRQIAKKLGIGFKVIVPSLLQQVDLMGVPVPDLENNETRWLRPGIFPRADRDGIRGIMLIDEINTAAQSLQACCFQLIQERRVGDHHLLEGWIPMAAGNRMIDRAAAQRMPTALRMRFAHFNVEPSLRAWKKWASAAKIDPYLIAFLSFRSELLHRMPEGDENCSPSPRMWEKAARFLKHPPRVRQMLIASCVGSATAAELEGFLEVQHELPTLEEVERDPGTAKVPDSPPGKYAVSAMLCRAVERKTFAAILQYAKRLGREFETLIATDCARRHPDLSKTGAFVAWANANQDVTL